MNATPPPFDSDDVAGDRLAGEISDVIEEHGRGLGAEEISSAVEEVAAELDEDLDDVSPLELQRELRSFLRDHCQHLTHEECIETLREIADDLRSGSLTPRVEFRDDEGDNHITVVFDSAFALRQELSNLLDIRGFFLETDRHPSPPEEVGITIETTRLNASVDLEGRVLRTAPNGVTLQIYEPPPDKEQRLRALPANMRAHR